MKKVIQSIVVITAVLFVSCDKSTDVNIITPKNGQVFNAGETVEVKAKLYDPDAISRVWLTATTEVGDTVYNYSVDLVGQSYTLLHSFTPPGQGMYNIKVRGGGGYGGSKTITISVE